MASSNRSRNSTLQFCMNVWKHVFRPLPRFTWYTLKYAIRNPRKIPSMLWECLIAVYWITGLVLMSAISGIRHLYWNTYYKSKARHIYHSRRLRRSLTQDGLRTIPQSSSTFLRLPLEIRCMIYEQYYDENKFIVVQLKRGLATRCVAMSIDAERKFRRVGDDPTRENIVQCGLLELPLVCKQIYAESIDYIYSRSTFWFTVPGQIDLLQTIIPPQRWHAITSIEYNPRLHPLLSLFQADLRSIDHAKYRFNFGRTGLKWGFQWKDFCTTVAGMERLERIEIWYGMYQTDLDHLMQVRQPLKKFDVWIKESDTEDRHWNQEWERGPFRLVLPDGSTFRRQM